MIQINPILYIGRKVKIRKVDLEILTVDVTDADINTIQGTDLFGQPVTVHKDDIRTIVPLSGGTWVKH